MIRIFGHYVSKWFLLLGMSEILISYLGLLTGFYLRFGTPDATPLTSYTLNVVALIYAMLVYLSMTSVGLYQRGQQFGAGMVLRISVGFLFTALALTLVFYAFPSLYVGRGIVTAAMFSTFVFMLLFRNIFLRLAADEAQLRRVLVLGSGKNAALVEQLRAEGAPFKVIGYVNLEATVPAVPRNMVVRWQTEDIEHMAWRHEIDELVIAPDDRRKRLPAEAILAAKIHGVEILDLISFFEKEGSRLPIDLITPSWIYFSEGFYLGPFARWGKRTFDVCVSLLILTLTSPLILLTILLSLLESGFRAPVFFSQVRVGRHGRNFKIYKFRSMRVDAEADGKARWATKNDSRITPLGKLIRKTRIDELPQLWNVLRGDMSLIGPRPERPEFVEQLRKKIPYYDERHLFRPGLAGWAQLRFSYGATEEDAREKLQYDLYYIKNASLFLDFVILLETVEVVLWGKGAH